MQRLRNEQVALLGALILLGACSRNNSDSSVTATSSAPPIASPNSPAPPIIAPSAEPSPSRSLRLLAAGDVSFGRLVGQMLLKNQDFAPFASMEPLFQSVDVRFVNLEGPISDRGTETVSPHNKLVFNGPPISARVLAKAHIDIVSTANNHAWDYGRSGLLETLQWLDKENIQHVGSGASLDEAWKPVVVERNGFRLAFVALNDTWNQAHVPGNSAREHVAGMDQDKLVEIVRRWREKKDIHAIVVSYHGGVEYQDEPLQKTQELARAAIDAGADVFLGHHPHVVQGITFYRDRPIVYSLGNLLMRMTSDHPETEMGLAVKVELTTGTAPQLFACPVRIFGVDPIPLGSDPQRKAYEPQFAQRLQNITKRVGSAVLMGFDADGCARVVPPANSP